nr:DUF1330 domain-containing protein [Klebsiella aerogenes]
MAAYWIAHVNIHDPHQYQHYMDLAPAAFSRYTARLLRAVVNRRHWKVSLLLSMS